METGPASQDIILNDNTAQHKSQRIMYILLAIFGVTIVILTILVIVTQRSNPPENAENYYYYLMTGDANTKELGKSNLRNPYIEEMVHSDNPDEYEEFYDNANRMLEGLKKQSHDASLDDVFETQLMYLGLFKFNSRITSKNSAGLIDLYISDNADEKQNLVNSMKDYADSSDESIKAYATVAKDLIRQVSDLAEYYHDVGCKGGSVAELSNCKVQKLIKYKIVNYYNNIDADFAEMESIVDSMVPVFLESARTMIEKGAMNE